MALGIGRRRPSALGADEVEMDEQQMMRNEIIGEKNGGTEAVTSYDNFKAMVQEGVDKNMDALMAIPAEIHDQYIEQMKAEGEDISLINAAMEAATKYQEEKVIGKPDGSEVEAPFGAEFGHSANAGL